MTLINEFLDSNSQRGKRWVSTSAGGNNICEAMKMGENTNSVESFPVQYPFVQSDKINFRLGLRSG